MFIFVSWIEPLDVSMQGTDLDGVLLHDEWIWRAQTGRRASNILQYLERSKEGKIVQAKNTGRVGKGPDLAGDTWHLGGSGARVLTQLQPQNQEARGYLWGGVPSASTCL